MEMIKTATETLSVQLGEFSQIKNPDVTNSEMLLNLFSVH